MRTRSLRTPVPTSAFVTSPQSSSSCTVSRLWSPQHALNFLDRRRPRPGIDQRKNDIGTVRNQALDGFSAVLDCPTSHHDIHREVAPIKDCLNLLSRG